METNAAAGPKAGKGGPKAGPVISAAAAAVASIAGDATNQTTDAADKPERHVEQLNPIRMKGAEFLRVDAVAIAHANTLPADLLKPDYWAHVAKELRPRAHVEVWADDGSWYAEVLVREVGRAYCRVHLKTVINFDEQNAAQSKAIEFGGYRVVHRGEFAQWSVIRLSDNQVMREELGTQGAAVDWVNERIKADD